MSGFLAAVIQKFTSSDHSPLGRVVMKMGVTGIQVKREIVSGLKLFQVTYRKGIRVDKSQFMVGSYGPKGESHQFLTPLDEAPKGMISRGHYTVKSKFTDDDKNIHLEWEWSFDIKKDWD